LAVPSRPGTRKAFTENDARAAAPQEEEVIANDKEKEEGEMYEERVAGRSLTRP